MDKGNDLFYVCSLIEYIGRERKLRRADVVSGLGEETIRRIYRYADTFHCEQIAKVADDFINLCALPADFIISDYYELLSRVINSEDGELLRNFILTVGVVSNHGNWFTSDNPNKELKVLAQSYDWLLFLTDKGISEFITDLLIDPDPMYVAVKAAFRKSYSAEKKGNVFTKVKMDYESDAALCSYFSKNLRRIEGWFNVISPKGTSLKEMKRDLSVLAGKDWEGVYGPL